MYGNQLTVLAPETFLGAENTIEYLDLGFNVIEEVKELAFPTIKYLNLERNKLTSIEGALNLLNTLQVKKKQKFICYN